MSNESIDSIAERLTEAVAGRIRRSLRSGAYIERTWGTVYGLTRNSDGAYECEVLLAGDYISAEGTAYGFTTTSGMVPAVGDTVLVERDDVHHERRVVDIVSQSAYHKLEIDFGAGRLLLGDGTTAPSVFMSAGAASPTQFADNKNDYAGDPNSSIWRLSSNASRDLTGIVAHVGMSVDLVNVGSNNIVLKHESSSSAVANRILTPSAGDLTLAAAKSAHLWYDSASSRWRVLSNT
jgi:hypothetical protein